MNSWTARGAIAVESAKYVFLFTTASTSLLGVHQAMAVYREPPTKGAITACNTSSSVTDRCSTMAAFGPG
jgi:hypothetical protein